MIKGIALTVGVSLVALILSKFISLGAVALAIVLGVILANTVNLHNSFAPGITFSEKKILAFAIATMGINLNFSILMELGGKTITLIILSMILTIFSGILLGRLFGIDKKFAMLLGVGNAVCGASAIGAVKGVIKPKEEFVGISVAVVNLLGAIGMFLIPALVILLGMNEVNGGILAGDTLQAVGQAVAAGFTIGDKAGESATVVKMGRVLMLTPVLLILLFNYAKSDEEIKNVHILKNIPLFIIGFIFFSLIASFNILPDSVTMFIKHLSHYALIVAMAGVGLKITFKSIKENGKVALLIGSIIFAIQIIFNVGYLKLIG